MNTPTEPKVAIQLDFQKGKYTVTVLDNGFMWASRYGEHWRSLNGDKLVLAMLHEIVRLQERDTILVAAMSEVKATDEGTSSQPISAIVSGCIKELNAWRT
jgi:hypothetical protein